MAEIGLLVVLLGLALTFFPGKLIRAGTLVAIAGAGVLWAVAWLRPATSQWFGFPVGLTAAAVPATLILLPVVALAAGASLGEADWVRRRVLALAVVAWLLFSSTPTISLLVLLLASLLPAGGRGRVESANGWQHLNREQALLLGAVLLATAPVARGQVHLGSPGQPILVVAGIALVLGLSALLGGLPFAADPGPASAVPEDAQAESAAWLALVAPAFLLLGAGGRVAMRGIGGEALAVSLFEWIAFINLGAGAAWPLLGMTRIAAWVSAAWTDIGLAFLGLATGTPGGIAAAALLLAVQALPRALSAWAPGDGWRRLHVLLGAGLPLTAAFAARLLLLEACGPLGGTVIAAAALLAIVSTGGQVRHLLIDPGLPTTPGSSSHRWLALAGAAAAVIVGVAPRLVSSLLIGTAP